MVVSESAFSLSSAFVHQALLLRLIHSNITAKWTNTTGFGIAHRRLRISAMSVTGVAADQIPTRSGKPYLLDASPLDSYENVFARKCIKRRLL